MTLPKPPRVDPSILRPPDSYKDMRDVWYHVDDYRLRPRSYGYPDNVARLWAPIDAAHQLIVALIWHAKTSVVCSMFGWDDAEINDLFLSKLEDEHVFVQLSLDSTQAQGPGEVPLIQKWGDWVGNSLSIGHSAYGGISHAKEFVLDGVLTIGGSMNLSVGGEGSDPKGRGGQDNELYLCWDAVYAAETRARLDAIHDAHLTQMAANRNKLVIDWAAKRTKLSPSERKKLRAGILP